MTSRILLLACIAAGAMVSTLRGQQPEQAATISGTAVSVDIHGNIFVLDNESSTLRMYSPDHTLLHEVGGQGWENDQFDRPAGLWARNGIDVFVADHGNHRVQRFDRNLVHVSSLFTRENSNPDERFGYPSDVALSRFGDLYVCDTENSRIVKVNRLNGASLPFGGFGAGQGRLLQPMRVQVGPNDNVYVLDPPRVVVFDNFGNYVQELSPGAFREPTALFADETGAAVLDSTEIYFFDADNRPGPVVRLESLLVPEGLHVRSFALNNGVLYLLSDSGLFTAPDPRR